MYLDSRVCRCKLHSGPSRLEWHSKTLPEEVGPADPISSAIFLFIIGKQIRRYLSGTVFADKSKRIYLQIKESTPDPDWEKSPEGAYILAYTGAKLIGAGGGGDLSLKPGLHSLQQIIRGFYTKRIEQLSGKEFARQQSTLFRTIDQNSRFLIEGVYQLAHVLSDGCPSCSNNSTNSPRHKSASIDTIDSALYDSILAEFDLWSQRAFRTTTIQRETLRQSISELYQSVGLKTPPILFAESPLAASVSAAFLSLLLHKNAVLSPQKRPQSLELAHDLERICRDWSAEELIAAFAKDTIFELVPPPYLVPRTERFGYWSSGSRESWLRDSAKDAPDSVLRAINQIVQDAAVQSAPIREELESFAAAKVENLPEDFVNDLEDDLNNNAKLAYLYFAESLCEFFRNQDKAMSDLLKRYLICWEYAAATISSFVPSECTIGAPRLFSRLAPAFQKRFAAWKESKSGSAELVLSQDFCIAADFPANLRHDGNNRLHNENGPAVLWRDGAALYYWHGMRVSKQLIEAPESLTIEQIFSENNSEIRRVMVERFGFERMVSAGGACLIQADEYGELYRFEFSNDEPLVVLQVINSTPEPDGTYKKYFLRVPTQTLTAHEAVAWTFALNPEEYAPKIQT